MVNFNRIENLVVVRKAEMESPRDMLCFETLTLAPLDRALVDLELLSGDERAWVDGYHARVREEIGARVDTDTADWLEDATRPL